MEYLSNCFWLLIPVLVWNVIFTGYLPPGYNRDIFWADIPSLVGTTENITKIVVFALPLLTQFSLKSPRQKAGLGIYLIGLLLYFSSWTLQIYLPQSSWSRSIWGYTAPAYTTIIFFVGISLIGKTSFIKISGISIIYLAFSVVFVVVHTVHSYLVFQRIKSP